MKKNKGILKIVIASAFIYTAMLPSNLMATDPEYETVVCPGSGESCKVKRGWLTHPDRSKGKDRGAIEITIVEE